MPKLLKRYRKVILWCVVIFTLSTMPSFPEVGFIWWDYILKKSAHVLEYAVLFTLYYQAMGKKNYLTPFLFTLAFALSDEYHQSFVQGRTAKFADIGFDSLGMLLAWFRLHRCVLKPLCGKTCQ